jgi:peptide/nickel transport system permease protein
LKTRIIIRTCLAILSVLVLTSIFAPWMPLASYSQIDLDHRLERPSSLHWLGTDELGRDLLSRLLYSGRISFLLSTMIVMLSLLIGLCVGSISGFHGGWLDDVLMRAADVMLAFPGILLAIGLMAVLGPSLHNVIIALVVVGWVTYARLSRALSLKLRSMEFVEASRSLGASSARILLRHILPNMVPALIVQASFSFAAVILAESALSFLGLGVQPPDPSWGNMLNDGKNHLLDAPYLTVFPGLAIFITVLCFNLLGDALRDRIDPRFRN